MSNDGIPLSGQRPSVELAKKALAQRLRYSKIDSIFPTQGRLRRSLYIKHLIHFEAGALYKERLFLAGNRTGKTDAACVEIVYHMTGLYPKWWKGKRFKNANDWWICGVNNKVLLDIQEKLLGDIGDFGSGWVPQRFLDFSYMVRAKKGDTLVSHFRVKHVSGHWSHVTLKSYEEGRAAFQSGKVNVWLDEEPPLDIYTEALTRTSSPVGEDQMILIMTFTPMNGMAETLEGYIGKQGSWETGEKAPGKWLTRAEIDDVPHFSDAEKAEMKQRYPEYQRDARLRGIPIFGAGNVYPFDESVVFIPRRRVPEHWKRIWAFDFGFRPDPAAILWGAVDPQTDILYLYAEHYQTERPRSVHAQVIKDYDRSAGFTIPGVCDPSGGGTSKNDGRTEIFHYVTEHGIKIQPARQQYIDLGVQTVYDRFKQGKILAFDDLIYFKTEFRAYRRDNKGVYRGANHLMDCLKYMVNSGLAIAKSYSMWTGEQVSQNRDYMNEISNEDSWHLWDDAWRYQ